MSDARQEALSENKNQEQWEQKLYIEKNNIWKIKILMLGKINILYCI